MQKRQDLRRQVCASHAVDGCALLPEEVENVGVDGSREKSDGLFVVASNVGAWPRSLPSLETEAQVRCCYGT